MFSHEIFKKNQIELNAPDGEFTWFYKNGAVNHFIPPSFPGVPSATKKSHDSISLQWSEPEYGVDSLINYVVDYKCENKKFWKEQDTKSAKGILSIDGLNPVMPKVS